MFAPRFSARPQARPATSWLVAYLKGVMALGGLLALSACDGMEVGSVPQCSVLQPNCSWPGPASASAAPATALSLSPAHEATSHAPALELDR